jgi:tetratricopeptide (TPR) repeat protein
MPDLTSLDGPELLHLGLEAAGRNDHGAAITYLKQAIDLPAGSIATSSDYAKVLYMLGAEYAQIGLMDRAQEYMGQAIDMDDSLHTARFQLGLLHLTQAQVEQSLQVLAPLEQLGPKNCFTHLGAGLRHLIHDEFADCRNSLLHGMQLNTESAVPNLALNGDIQKLLAALPNADADQGTADPAAEPTAEASFLMSSYNRGGTTN